MDKLFKETEKVLSDVEREKLVIINKDPIMKEALKKLFLLEVYYKGTMRADIPAEPLVNYTLSMVSKKGQYTAEEIGRDLMVTWEGINCIQTGFDVLEKFKESAVKSPFTKENPAV